MLLRRAIPQILGGRHSLSMPIGDRKVHRGNTACSACGVAKGVKVGFGNLVYRAALIVHSFDIFDYVVHHDRRILLRTPRFQSGGGAYRRQSGLINGSTSARRSSQNSERRLAWMRIRERAVAIGKFLVGGDYGRLGLSWGSLLPWWPRQRRSSATLGAIVVSRTSIFTFHAFCSWREGRSIC
jgi:hypothetical protein